MTRRAWWAVLASALLSATVAVFTCLHLLDDGASQDPAQTITLPSKVLAETRTLRVQLPASYAREPARRYPVVYVLDGASQDLHTAASAALMARIGVMPEAIIVGIPNLDGDSRNRDTTPPGMRQDADVADSPHGRGDRFLAFLRDEAIPDIDRRYRTTPQRVLAGNSRAGLFVVHALTQAPDLFDAWIANSPALWRDNDAMATRLAQFLRTHPDIDTRLFLSLGSDENPKMRRGLQRTLDTLRSRAPPTLHWHASTTPGATHDDNSQQATPQGLRWSLDPTWTPPPMQ